MGIEKEGQRWMEMIGCCFVHWGLLMQILKSKVNSEFHTDNSAPHVKIKFPEGHTELL